MGRSSFLTMDFDYIKVQNGAKVVIDLLKSINEEYKKTKNMKFNFDTTNINASKKDIENLTKAYQNFSKTSSNLPKDTMPKPDTDNMNNYAKTILSVGLAYRTLTKIGDNFKGFMNMQTAVSNLAVASNKSLSDMGKIYEDFYGLANRMPVSAESLVRATDMLVRTGKSYKEALTIARESAKLSVATGEDLSFTMSTVSKLITALRINAEDTDKVLNTLHSTAIQTASSMESISGGFKQVAGVLGAVSVSSGKSGKDLDEYKQKLLDLGAAGLGVMNNLGKSASYQI